MTKKDIKALVKDLNKTLEDASRYMWNNPEVGGEEKLSVDYYKKLFKEEGFTIFEEEKLPTAFYAEYGSGSPVIAVLGEYDALPGLSQKVSTVKEAVVDGGPGHGCGHNLIGAASAVAAIAIKRFLEKNKQEGSVRFYASPEEELLSGKVKMAKLGMFDGADFAISWHPMSYNAVFDKAFLANAAEKFYFKGVSSHAAFAPELGRSALDAVELMSVGTNYLREHVIERARIHYTTDSMGYAPNIVHPFANAWYYVRAPYMQDVKDILPRLEKVAEGAAMMTETEVKKELQSGCYEMLENISFADLVYENMKLADPQDFTKEEEDFAQALMKSEPKEKVDRQRNLCNTGGKALSNSIQPRDFQNVSPMSASSDSGDVSQMMPMCLFTTACWPVGAAPHTWQASAATGHTMAEKGALLAAEVLALTAYDLLTKPEAREIIKKEFDEKKQAYEPMIEI
ncbi:MAG: amidohydrolase [Tissierellia bacterium]|nr:amidohydrolase [Tissierellia bacterium]